MRLDKNEVLYTVFELTGETMQALNVPELRKCAIPCKRVELSLPLRDRVTEINFSENGFKELSNCPAHHPKEVGQEGLMDYFKSNLMGLTILDIDSTSGLLRVTPNFIINIKNDEVFNLFDTIDRLKFYNFLTDIVNKDSNDWKIVTAPNREFHMTFKKFFDVYPWALSMITKEGEDELALRRTITVVDDDLPFKRVNDLLKQNSISLLNFDVTLMELTMDFKNGKVKEEDFTTEKFNSKYGIKNFKRLLG